MGMNCIERRTATVIIIAMPAHLPSPFMAGGGLFRIIIDCPTPPDWSLIKYCVFN
jgi:hypothetical protein